MSINKEQCFAVLVLVLAVSTCAFAAETSPMPEPSAVTAGVEGVISVGPTHGGPIRVGVPNSRPLANTAFVVENEKGTVSSFTTDDQGRFRVELTPGHYTFSIKEKKSGKIGHYGPFAVDVAAGKMTKVEWQCDTGMR